MPNNDDCLREACQLCWDGDARWADCLDRLRLPDAAACELKESIETRRDNAMSADDLYQQARLLPLNAYSAADIREYGMMEGVDVSAEAEIEEVIRAVKNLEQEKMKAEQEVQAAEDEAKVVQQMAEEAEQAEREAQEARRTAEKQVRDEERELLQEEEKCKQAAEDLRQLEKEAERLEEEKEQLEQKEREAQRELEELQAAERRTKEEWENLKKEQEDIESQIEQLEEQMATLQQEIANLKDAIEKYDAEIADCERELEKANQEIRRLQDEIKKLKGQMEEIEANINKKMEASEQRDREAMDLETQAQQLEGEAASLDAKAKSVMEAAKAVAAAAACIPFIGKGIAAGILDDAPAVAAVFTFRAQGKRGEAAQRKSRAQAERAHAEGLRREVNRLEGDYSKAATRLGEAETSLAEQRGNVSRLTEERKVLKASRSAACDKKKEAQKQHDSLKVSEVGLKTRLGTMHWSKEEVQSRIREVRSGMDNAKQQMAKVDGQMKKVEMSRNVTRDEHRAAITSAGNLSAKFQVAQARVASATAACNDRSLEAKRVCANWEAIRRAQLERLTVAKSEQCAPGVQAQAPVARAVRAS
eukprot:TRINITY_DN793_c0_g1_i3.p1 TRINITY_DN793_c0_g1~~TRINITY_DN793_c0_g1_i3.p1  ORF type:complete len:590 (+),score=198.74 TRINITY_DN793_c0_g1_i3:49-1818(+)